MRVHSDRSCTVETASSGVGILGSGVQHVVTSPFAENLGSPRRSPGHSREWVY